MAKEYIEREATVMKIREWFWSAPGVHPKLDRDTAEDILFAIPAADVRPVVRGRWVHGDYGPYCSNCDGYPPTRKRYGHPGDTEFDYTKFCPSCGADMREVQDDD